MARNIPSFIELQLSRSLENDDSLSAASPSDSLSIMCTDDDDNPLRALMKKMTIEEQLFSLQDNNVYHSHTILEFDMRGKFGKSVRGKTCIIGAHPSALRHRYESKYNVLKNQVIIKDNIFNTVSHSYICVAIIDVLAVQKNDLTLFIQTISDGSNTFKCVNVSYDCSVSDFLRILSSHSQTDYWPFNNGKRLTDTTLQEQGVRSGCLVDLYKVQKETFKCRYRVTSKLEQIYTVECLSTNSIIELKQNIRSTISELNQSHQTIPVELLSGKMWLTKDKRIYADEEYVGILDTADDSSDESKSILSDYYDFDISLHFQYGQYIPIFVSFRKADSRSLLTETLIILYNCSADHLREQVSKYVHCEPNAVKILVNGKKLPMVDDLSKFSEFKEKCVVYAGVRRPITVNVEYENLMYMIPIFKLDLVKHLKHALSLKIQKAEKIVKLTLEDKELLDYNRIEKENIKDNSFITAVLVPERNIVSIRKRSLPLTHIYIEDLSGLSVRDLTNFYRHIIKLNIKQDIKLYKFRFPNLLSDTLPLSEANFRSREVLYAIEYKKHSSCPPIFETSACGNCHWKDGMIHNGQIYYSPDSSREDYDIETDSSCDQEYSLPSALPTLRLAHPIELEETQRLSPPVISAGPLNNNYSNNSLTTHTNQLVPTWRRMTHSITTPDHLAYSNQPGVVSDRDLDLLAKELPGPSWQSFIRCLDVPQSIIYKHMEAYPRDVVEAIYHCLLDWKQRKGIEALQKTIQKCLIENNLRMISEQVFGYETV